MGMMTAGSLWSVSVAPPPKGPRYLAVYLPAFRVERCGWAADDMVAMVAERRSATRIVALTPAARERGLREEMTAAEARSLVSEVTLEPLNEAEEEEDRCAMQRAFEALGDRVEGWGRDVLVMEISSTSALYGGEDGLLTQVAEQARSFGHACRLALSDHPRASVALARHHATTVIVPRGKGASALAELPIHTLGPSSELLEVCRTLGLHTIGQLARLDAASVGARFGEEGVALHRVAHGRAAPSWCALSSTPPLDRIQLQPEEELEQVEGLLALVRTGLLQLQRELEARGEAVSCLDVRLDPTYGTSVWVRLRVGHPTSRADKLTELLKRRFEALVLEAPVSLVMLQVREMVPARHHQEDLLERRETVEPLPELLARLEDVLGEQAVFWTEPVNTWRPEAAWRARGVRASPAQVAVPAKIDPVEQLEGEGWSAAVPRPTSLRKTPLPIRVREQDGRPAAIWEARAWWALDRVRGPEKLEGDWWHGDGGYQRIYWIVEVEGEAMWVFEERGQWFLHGWF